MHELNNMCPPQAGWTNIGTHLVLLYPDNHLSLLSWQPVLSGLILTNLVSLPWYTFPVTMTATWSFLSWQPLHSFYPNSHLVPFIMTAAWSFLSWQPLGPFYPDSHWVLFIWYLLGLFLYWQSRGPFLNFTLISNWSLLPWHWHDPATLSFTWPCYPDIHLALLPYPLGPFTLTSTWPCYPDIHLALLPWHPLCPVTLTST